MSKVLITAGGSGLGRAMATAFHDAGHEVWATDISEAGLENVPWQTTRTDSSSETDNQNLFNEIQSVWGGIDVVCANAGIAGPTAGVENVSLNDWRECVSVNLEGAFLTAKYATPLMKQQKSGAMIFTSSTAGIFGYPNRAPYAAAKWGIIGLMKTIAMELGPFGVRANVIAPGAVEGPRMEGVLAREAAAKGMTRDQVYKGYAAGTSMRTFVTAQDVAAMALFLGSDAAARVSGQVIAVDGHTENPDPKP
ncbi:SDR family oxidoreductase [Yoonia sp.]|uniref:SDR family oxidoreductase n=1 Tax=Yoonia sp. TaxID=2212373 RepID=UPI002387BDEA|nr:SDR family oxidoreductase [Yoonia sp.]MDE0850285.1 SDR family oxidoreductase [Yoonia sp.]